MDAIGISKTIIVDALEKFESVKRIAEENGEITLSQQIATLHARIWEACRNVVSQFQEENGDTVSQQEISDEERRFVGVIDISFAAVFTSDDPNHPLVIRMLTDEKIWQIRRAIASVYESIENGAHLLSTHNGGVKITLPLDEKMIDAIGETVGDRSEYLASFNVQKRSDS